MKHLKSLWYTMAGTVLTALPMQASAVESPFKTGALPQLQKVGETSGIGGGNTNLPAIIGSIINVILGFLGIVFLVLLLYAGFLWMTAQGDEKKVDKARAMISQSIIGLIIIIAAFAISTFVLGSLVNVTAQ